MFAAERDAHDRGDGEGEAGEEARVMALVVAAHVADAVEVRQDPQAAGDDREQQAQRFDVERQVEARHHREQHEGFRRAVALVGQDHQHAQEGQRPPRPASAPSRRFGLSRKIRLVNDRREGDQHAQKDGDIGVHLAPLVPARGGGGVAGTFHHARRPGQQLLGGHLAGTDREIGVEPEPDAGQRREAQSEAASISGGSLASAALPVGC